VEYGSILAYSKQCSESYVNICMCMFLLEIIIQIAVTKTEVVWWVVES
jgi:hypothetical protein